VGKSVRETHIIDYYSNRPVPPQVFDVIHWLFIVGDDDRARLTTLMIIVARGNVQSRYHQNTTQCVMRYMLVWSTYSRRRLYWCMGSDPS